ncbi:MAG: DNA-directed RNA polymerase subunit beta [Puniceicoccales bacterium]|jgi:DNA-directed RNA polymerase subunit beta|nr:DNA-directed RNA polymerase subunit beta [Puniceicoccales bacterium]
MTDRINFGRLREVICPPDFIENQINSFREFLQSDVAAGSRKNIGLESAFRDFFPVESYDGKCRLEYVTFRVCEPRHNEDFCVRDGTTYAGSLYVTLRLCEGGEMREEEIYFGELPMMGGRGSFVINGAERVVVSQLHRSPGICFEETLHASGKLLHAFRIIPDRGTWLEVQFDQNDLLYVYLDRRRRRRKFLLTTLLRAFGNGSDQEILNLFYRIENKKLTSFRVNAKLANYVLIDDVVDAKEGIVLARAHEALSKGLLQAFEMAGIDHLEVVNVAADDGLIIRTLKRDPAKNTEDALREIYKRLRPGEPVTANNANGTMSRLFFERKRYDLGRVGRKKMNQRLKLNKDLENRLIDTVDIVEATKFLCRLKKGEEYTDDIDHLGNRRIRNVGELLVNQCRSGLGRMERLIRERMALFDNSVDTIVPQKLVNPKIFMGAIRDFFTRSQLSQFMDQINPLSELAHKRRLSALGPGGLSRERAGFEVRDVHASHYGRICPIETPEGPNIGLINSLSTFARVNEFGFIETPYRVVRGGKVTEEIVYLDATDEGDSIIAQANSEIDGDGNLVGNIAARQRDIFLEVEGAQVDYMDVSPKQVISVAAGLIPFLEHDDTSRALMGSNMQRQGVPLLSPEAPFVGTGLERRVAVDSRSVVLAAADGVVASVVAARIVVTKDGTMPKKLDPKGNPAAGIYVYNLRKFIRSNSTTCFNQRPIVSKGQAVKAGDVLADGAGTDCGELALGRNVLVAFMPWNGYNFQDAIILSDRLVKEDIFTSVHIEEFEVVARDTKLGAEEITRDIPNMSDLALKDLNRDGVVRIGAEVKAGDILVGKITPKSETDLVPEEKLLRAIFGEKASDVKDTSLVVPPGCEGIVMDVKFSSNIGHEKEDMTDSDVRRFVKKTNEEFRSQLDKLQDDLTESLSSILLGEKIPLDISNRNTGETIIAANRKITKTLLRRIAACFDALEIPASPVKNRILEIVDAYRQKFIDLENERLQRIEAIEAGDMAESGVIKNVKVYVANKRKIHVGDKMAGRHGNKGVVSKIVHSEDMPFLPDGTPVDIILNPLGVPSRMNVGQVLETHLGWACEKLGIKIATPVFDGMPESQIREYLEKANLPESGKSVLFDGRTGERFDQEVVVGYIYMMKLNHLVADKIHARAVGPYSLVTQQPLGGKAQYGGQRFGEMEVWALEAYGAAYTLQEMLTVKSDDVQGRTKAYESLVKGDRSLQAGVPQSFNVLMKEIQSLCLDIRLEHNEIYAEHEKI